MNKEKIVLSLIIILLFGFRGNCQFYRVDSGTTNNLNAVFFINEMLGFVAGDNGTILRSEDSGDNWDLITILENVLLKDISFFDEQNGVAIGEKVLITNNSGLSWQVLSLPTDEYLDIEIVSNNTAYISSLNQGLLKTTDYGGTWTQIQLQTSDTDFGLLSFVSSSIGYSMTKGPLGLEDIILKTIDGGASWTPQDVQSDLDFSIIERLIYITEDLAIRCGWYDGYLKKSEDGGLNWFSVDLSNANSILQFFDVAMVPNTNNIMYSCGHDSIIIKSENQGESWYVVHQPESPTAALHSVYFINSNKGWAVGNEGTILKTENGGGTLMLEEFKENNKIRIYPNPVSDFLKLHINTSCDIENLEIYDMYGKRIHKIEYSNQIKIETDYLNSGAYILKIYGKDYIQQLQFLKK